MENLSNKTVSIKTQNRITTKNFLKNISKKSNYKYSDIEDFYKLFINELINNLHEGKEISLYGFGKFYLLEHKGNSVFCDNNFFEKRKTLKNYKVVKFSSSKKMSGYFR